MPKTSTSSAEHLRPVPEYLQNDPIRRSYTGPALPPAAPITEEARAEALEIVRAQLCAQYGAAAVCVQSVKK